MNSPLHEAIRADFEGLIMSGQLRPGDKIPVEHELMKKYGCSRMTVNKALSALSTAGFVERNKRAGTVVARPKVNSMVLDIPDLSVEVANRGQTYSYRLIHRAERKANPESDEEKRLVDGRKLLEINCVHSANETAIGIEYRVVNLKAVPALRHIDVSVEPVGRWLLHHVPWTEAEIRLSSVGVDPQSAEHLNVPAGTPCLQVERWTWQNDEPITYVRTLFLGSYYSLMAKFGSDRT